jgi:hypothetical protein
MRRKCAVNNTGGRRGSRNPTIRRSRDTREQEDLVAFKDLLFLNQGDTEMCNSEHEEAKRSRQKCKKFFQEQAEVNKPSRYAEDAPNARSWGGNALSDRRRSLCAASKANKEEPWRRLVAIEGTPGRVVAV